MFAFFCSYINNLFMDKLSSSPRINQLLHLMGIYSYYDVIYHLPRKYENLSYTEEKHLSDKQRVVVLGKIIDQIKIVKNHHLEILTFSFLTINKTYYKVVAFNRGYLTKTLNNNDLFSLVGIYQKKNNEISLINIYKGEISPDKRFKPLYSLPKSYPQHLFANLVEKSYEQVKDHIFSYVPYDLMNKYRLIDKKLALKYAHFPTSQNEIHQALRYLKYEEALLFSLKNQLIKEENKSLAKIKKEPIDLSLCQPLIDSLPYQLTKDQENACEEIILDMNQSSLMYRLLQGDVGTGKTLVSFIVLYANYLRGDQGALMAPTDALAKQHYQNALEIYKNTKIKVALLLGSTPLKEKKQIQEDLFNGDIDIVIGTHTLFSKGTNYAKLGLAIIDEQHRFGVNQRITLASKGEHADLLLMSATPIPRSLALTLYGDLDISTLFSFPNKKRQVETLIVNDDDVLIDKYIEQSLNNHKNIYIIAPLIDYSDDQRYSVEKLFIKFHSRYKDKVGLLHGKLSSEDKNNALEKFYHLEKPILISTQVIEVGIDVRNADLMIIYDANNFGLASLHQLRGRIGRDGNLAKCILVSNNEEDNDRLNVLKNNDDGFKIAEADLTNRGPGELNGLKQSGLPDFNYLNIIDDMKIFIVARDDAKIIMKDQNNPHFKYILEKAKKDIVYNPVIKG